MQPGIQLYSIFPIFITLFLYMSALCDGTWVSIFLLVLYLWTLEFNSRDWQYCCVKHVTSNIYREADRILISLNNCLQDVS